jgi:hypothetical protein
MLMTLACQNKVLCMYVCMYTIYRCDPNTIVQQSDQQAVDNSHYKLILKRRQGDANKSRQLVVRVY